MEKEIDEKCLNLVNGRLCSVRRYPSPMSYAFIDLSSDAQAEAIRNRGHETCSRGSLGCFPKYSSKSK